MANEAKRNETETGHEANKGNDRQAGHGTRRHETERDETERRQQRPQQSRGGKGGEGEGEGEAGGGGNGPVQESCGPGWEARPT